MSPSKDSLSRVEAYLINANHATRGAQQVALEIAAAAARTGDWGTMIEFTSLAQKMNTDWADRHTVIREFWQSHPQEVSNERR